jgi:uncharacterized protein
VISIRNSITFVITPECNLKCKYCFQNDSYPGNAHAKPTKNTIDEFVFFCKKEKITHVDIFGGEPLFYKDLFIYLITNLKKQNPDIKIGITTNGTMMDEEILRYIKDFQISVLVSLDGNKEIHNKMRGGFDQIIKWTRSFNDKEKLSVALQAGIVDNLYNNIKYVWDLGFADGVFVNVLQNYQWYTEKDIITFENEYEKAIKGMLNEEGKLNCAISTFHQIEASEKTNTCGITSQGLASDWNGILYPCHRAVELGKNFSIGSIFSGLDPSKSNEIRSNISFAIDNSESTSKYITASYCPVSIFQKHKTFTGEWCDECCRMIDIKAKLVAKYYYEIKNLLNN